MLQLQIKGSESKDTSCGILSAKCGHSTERQQMDQSSALENLNNDELF